MSKIFGYVVSKLGESAQIQYRVLLPGTKMDLGNNIKRNAKYSMGQVLGFAPVNGFVCSNIFVANLIPGGSL